MTVAKACGFYKKSCDGKSLIRCLQSFGYQQKASFALCYTYKMGDDYPDIALDGPIDCTDLHPDVFNHIYMRRVVLKKKGSSYKSSLSRSMRATAARA